MEIPDVKDILKNKLYKTKYNEMKPHISGWYEVNLAADDGGKEFVRFLSDCIKLSKQQRFEFCFANASEEAGDDKELILKLAINDFAVQELLIEHHKNLLTSNYVNSARGYGRGASRGGGGKPSRLSDDGGAPPGANG